MEPCHARERTRAASASPPVFSRPPWRPPRPVSLSVLRKPPAASAQECMKSVTAPRRNLPFESTWTPFTVIRCLPPEREEEKKKEKKLRPLSSLLISVSLSWPRSNDQLVLQWPRIRDKIVARGRSLFIHLRVLKITSFKTNGQFLNFLLESIFLFLVFEWRRNEWRIERRVRR